MREHTVNTLDNFICGWYLEDTSICDQLIEYHKNNDKKYQGKHTYPGTNRKETGITDLSVKDSMDCKLHDRALLEDYLPKLQSVTDLYVEKYQYCNMGEPWVLENYPTIQHYKPGGGFHAWHYERSHKLIPVVLRHLQYMTYLNDVEEDGETEFFYQKLKIKPQKGLTIIWPTDWTFTHRGITSMKEDKYIITGSYIFK